ncbi:hypothetical protein F4778DRAFT_751359 [Xylariomycetidae sp. FL2044]|nr:hypothetical protein F4778DRAFT_751359 [Xylariomycetidae sp. FL2044]
MSHQGSDEAAHAGPYQEIIGVRGPSGRTRETRGGSTDDDDGDVSRRENHPAAAAGRGGVDVDREQALVDALRHDWARSETIEDERRTNGPLAALDMLATTAHLEAMRLGLPAAGSPWSFWIAGMRAALQE